MFAGRTCDSMEDPYCSSLFLKDCFPSEGPTLEQAVKNCRELWEGLTLDKLVEDGLPWKVTHSGAGEGCEEFSPEEEVVTEMCDELTATPIAHLPVPLRGGGNQSGIKLSP